MTESLGFISDLGLILIFTKVLGMISRKFRLPQVIGAIMAGLLLGPAMLNIITETEFIHDLSKLGVIVLMFGAGMHTDMSSFKKNRKAILCGCLRRGFGALDWRISAHMDMQSSGFPGYQ